MGKGSAFEREICKRLSEWWTNGERSDIFWRTACSGGRATVRGRQGLSTAGGHGDITALDPIGEPFLKAFAVEIKRGYNKYTIHDLIDRPSLAAQQMFEAWHQQAVESMNGSGAMGWLIIAKRDKRDALVFIPSTILVQIGRLLEFKKLPKPYAMVCVDIRHLYTQSKNILCTWHPETFRVMTLTNWLAYATPEVIKKLVAERET